VRPAALLFDFNGTLSDDEHIQCEIYREIFAEAGKPLGETEYFAQLAGLSDPEIVRAWLGEERPELVAERVSRFQARAADGSTVGSVATRPWRSARSGTASSAAMEGVEARTSAAKSAMV